MKSILFAIDFDETFSRDPACFANIIQAIRDSNHKALIVTCRRETEENAELIRGMVAGQDIRIGVLFTNLRPKRDVLREHGYDVDNVVWMDDDPECIYKGK